MWPYSIEEPRGTDFTGLSTSPFGRTKEDKSLRNWRWVRWVQLNPSMATSLRFEGAAQDLSTYFATSADINASSCFEGGIISLGYRDKIYTVDWSHDVILMVRMGVSKWFSQRLFKCMRYRTWGKAELYPYSQSLWLQKIKNFQEFDLLSDDKMVTEKVFRIWSVSFSQYLCIDSCPRYPLGLWYLLSSSQATSTGMTPSGLSGNWRRYKYKY